MSIYHKDKCSKKELAEFRLIVVNWLEENNLKYKKLIALPYYNGEIRVYSGYTETRKSKKKVLQKDDKGYFRGYVLITNPTYVSVYRMDWYKYAPDEQEALFNFLKFYQ